MQCAKCQTTIEPDSSGDMPAICPQCGAAMPADSASRRRGISWVAIVAIVLILALAAVSIGSTLFALRTIEERDRAEKDLARCGEALDASVSAAVNSDELKGAEAVQAREKILRPVVNYYQNIVQEYGDDERMLPEVASAQLHLAGLQAKLGSAECKDSLNNGLITLRRMIAAPDADFVEEDFPSFQATVLRVATPEDWLNVKTPNRQLHAYALISAISSACSAYRDLAARYPKTIEFRDDLSVLLAVPSAGELARRNPIEARDVLETLVRDQPSNAEFRARLADALLATAKNHEKAGEKEQAINDCKRAAELRQQLAEANPQDQSLAQKLAKVNSELERLQTAEAPQKKAEANPTEPAEPAEPSKAQ